MGLSEALAGSTSLSGLMTSMAMSAIENSTAEAPRHMVNYVDVAAITGLAKFGNGLNPLDAIPGDSGDTQYKAELPTFATIPVINDLNFDVNNDKLSDPYEVKDYDNSGTLELGFYLNGHQPGDRNALGSLIPPDVVKPLSEFQKTITVRPVTSAIDFDADGVSEFDFDGDGLPDPTDVKDYNNDGSNEVGFFLNGRKPEDKDANGVPSARPRRADPPKISVFLKHSASTALIFVQFLRECRCFWVPLTKIPSARRGFRAPPQ